MTRARVLADLSTPNAFTVDDNYNVGINTTIPTEKLDVVGVVSATKYYGDGSELTGVSVSNTLTIGVRTGTAVTFSISGSSFNVLAKGGGNVPINV
jgi:hypothetical protein